MIALLTTTDPVKLTAAQAVLSGAQVAFEVFDAAAGSMWGSAIPRRLMIDDGDLVLARRALVEAGFAAAADGDWDLHTA